MRWIGNVGIYFIPWESRIKTIESVFSINQSHEICLTVIFRPIWLSGVQLLYIPKMDNFSKPNFNCEFSSIQIYASKKLLQQKSSQIELKAIILCFIVIPEVFADVTADPIRKNFTTGRKQYSCKFIFLPKTVFDRIPKEELSHADEIAAVWHFDVSQPQFHFCFTFDNKTKHKICLVKN